jgi:undecaprenyl-diphosphatase
MNQAIFYFFYSFAHQSKILDDVIIFFAVYFPYLVIIIAGVFILVHHEVFKEDSTWKVFLEKKKEIFGAFATGAMAWILAQVLKLFVHIPRPFISLPNIHNLFVETGYSMPSGHATFFSALALSIFFYHKKAGYWFMFFALLIGIARIAGGVHFPSDILAGFALGSLTAFFLHFI